MALTATIHTQEQHETIRQLFATELSRKHERSSVTLENVDGNAVFHIDATDVTALRAAINSITSILAVHEKTSEIIHGKRQSE